MNGKLQKIIALLAAVAVLASGWYFFYWLKSPQYSIGIIADAVRQHDLKTFEKHVDMDALYGKAYDDIVAVTFGQDKDANPIIVAIVKGIKGLAVPLLSTETRNYVRTGKMDNEPAAGSKAPANGGDAEIVDNIKERTGFRDLRYDGVEKTEINGGGALVSIKLHDKKLSADFIVTLKMQELDDGTWRLTEIANLQEFMLLREAAVNQKLAELNKPIAAEINQKVGVSQKLLRNTSVHYSKVISLLETELELENRAGKNIAYIAGTLELFDDNGTAFCSGSFASNAMLNAGAKKLYKFDWELNPYVSEDAQVINSDLNRIKWQATLTNVAFDDGTSLDYLTSLPGGK